MWMFLTVSSEKAYLHFEVHHKYLDRQLTQYHCNTVPRPTDNCQSNRTLTCKCGSGYFSKASFGHKEEWEKLGQWLIKTTVLSKKKVLFIVFLSVFPICLFFSFAITVIAAAAVWCGYSSCCCCFASSC